MAFFDIALRTGGSLHPAGEPSDFVSEYAGVIRCEREDGRRATVGRVRAYRIHADLALECGESLFDVCDAHSQSMHELHTALYGREGYTFRDCIVSDFDAVSADCLVLDYVILNPRWRRLRLGLLAVRKLVDLLGGGCGLVVSEVLPIRHEVHRMLRVPPRWLPRHASRQEAQVGTVRLRRYFRQAGFRRIGRSDYYGLSMVQQTPTAAELLARRAARP